MILIYLKRLTVKEGNLRRERETEFKTVLRVLTLLLLVMATLAGCSPPAALNRTTAPVSGSYDTTLYNITLLEGARVKMLGGSSDALSYFERALKINPNSDVAAYEMSRILYGRGDLDNAIKYGEMAVNLANENRWYLNHMATLYFTSGNTDSVVTVFERMVELNPEDDDVIFNLGGLYMERGQAEKAEPIFRDFRKRYGDNEQIVIALLNSLNEQNRAEDSEQLLREMIEKYPDNITYKGMLAENYRKYGDPGKALSIYRELFEEDPDNPLLHLSYIDFLIEEESYEELAVVVDQAILNDSIQKEAKISILMKLVESKEYVLSYKDRLVLSALLLEASYKDDPDAIYAVATVYGAVGDKEKEIAQLKKRAEADDKNYAYWEELLIKVNEAGDMEQLYTLGGYISREFNIYPFPKLLYAFAATDRGEYDLALSELAKVRILINEQREFMIQILSLEADIYYRKGSYDDSFLSFEKALEIDPDEAMILNNYAYFLSEQDRELDKAEELIVRCLKIERNVTYLDTYAWVLFKLKKYKRAESVMKEIFEEEVSDAELLEHYGYIKRALGNCTEAVRLWNLSLAVDSSKSYLVDEINRCLEKK